MKSCPVVVDSFWLSVVFVVLLLLLLVLLLWLTFSVLLVRCVEELLVGEDFDIDGNIYCLNLDVV